LFCKLWRFLNTLSRNGILENYSRKSSALSTVILKDAISAQSIQKAPKLAKFKMPLIECLECDEAGEVRLLEIGASWALEKHLHCEPRRTSQPHC
jgi:hypothetical protein